MQLAYRRRHATCRFFVAMGVFCTSISCVGRPSFGAETPSKSPSNSPSNSPPMISLPVIEGATVYPKRQAPADSPGYSLDVTTRNGAAATLSVVEPIARADSSTDSSTSAPLGDQIKAVADRAHASIKQLKRIAIYDSVEEITAPSSQEDPTSDRHDETDAEAHDQDSANEKADQSPEMVRREYVISVKGKKHRSELVVFERDGWIIKFRLTWPEEVAEAEAEAKQIREFVLK